MVCTPDRDERGLPARWPEVGLVCPACRDRIRTALVGADDDHPGISVLVRWLTAHYLDSAVMPARHSRSGRVTGGQVGSPAPIPISAHDLLDQQRQHPAMALTAAGRIRWCDDGSAPDGTDQIGMIAVGTELGYWVDAWRERRKCGERRPDWPVGWLVARLDDACDQDPLVGEFAAVVLRLRAQLAAVTGRTPQRPDVKLGVECPSCYRRSTLEQRPGSEWVECTACPRILRIDEYQQWVRSCSAYERQQHKHANTQTAEAA
jgi:hypothetical protein